MAVTYSLLNNYVPGFGSVLSKNEDDKKPEGDQKYAAAKNGKKQWSPWETFLVVLFIGLVILYIAIVISAVYTASNRSGAEMAWSGLMALFIPEVWVCYHGIDATRMGKGFFEKLPAH